MGAKPAAAREIEVLHVMSQLGQRGYKGSGSGEKRFRSGSPLALNGRAGVGENDLHPS